MQGTARLFASAATSARRAEMREIEEATSMPQRDGERGTGEDLGRIEIEHYATRDRPDLIPDGVGYISNYRLCTPDKVLFFDASHRITNLPDNALDLDITFAPVKHGQMRYASQTSSQFSAAEIARIREIIADYLKTNPKALHPILAPPDRVRSIRVHG